jgi:hypothetical protein
MREDGMEVENGRQKNTFDPIFIIGIVGKCNLDVLKKIKDFFAGLEGFETIYIKTTKGKKLWIKESDGTED